MTLETVKKNQPVLIGTASIESSEYLSKALTKEKINHNVLNAKQHEKESIIIEDAGTPGRVTIATNMAGRGTDIVLGGKLKINSAEWEEFNKNVLNSGGLHVIGTERHESRRVDNQLRGRSGRQGDPGSSRFYLSLEDNLMRIFASEKVSTLMKKLGMEKGEAIEHNWVTKAIGNAQKKVEGHNFDIRKHLLDYDDVANEQRKYIYEKRDSFLAKDNRKETLEMILIEVFEDLINNYININSEDKNEINDILQRDFHLDVDAEKLIKNSSKKEEAIEKIISQLKLIYNKNISNLPEDIYLEMIKDIFINIIDKSWIEHIQSMEYLRQGIGLRSYAQKNPKQEYKREAFVMFSDMQKSIHYSFISLLFRLDYSSLNINKDFSDNSLIKKAKTGTKYHKEILQTQIKMQKKEIGNQRKREKIALRLKNLNI